MGHVETTFNYRTNISRGCYRSAVIHDVKRKEVLNQYGDSFTRTVSSFIDEEFIDFKAVPLSLWKRTGFMITETRTNANVLLKFSVKRYSNYLS